MGSLLFLGICGFRRIGYYRKDYVVWFKFLGMCYLLSSRLKVFYYIIDIIMSK